MKIAYEEENGDLKSPEVKLNKENIYEFCLVFLFAQLFQEITIIAIIIIFTIFIIVVLSGISFFQSKNI